MSDETADISELFKGSPRPIDDLMSESDPEQAAIQALYEQAVKAAQEGGWPAPEREEFQRRYQAEVKASRNQE